MSEETQVRAKKIVETFKLELSKSAKSEVGENNFEKLTMLVNEAIQEERKEVASLIEGVVKTLRKEVDIPELGM